MKIINYILQASGFDSFNDVLGVFYPAFNSLLAFSLVTGSIVAFIEIYSGISILLWLFFLFAAVIDLSMGLYANLVFLNYEYDSKRFFRGVFKAFALMNIIFLTNMLKLGIERSTITPEWVQLLCNYTTASIHYIFILLIGLYVLLGIAENGAKMEMRVFESLVKILKIKINNVEEKNEENGAS